MATSVLLVLLASTIPAIFAQVPRVCVQNATQVNATCCPPSGPKMEPCGGPTHGQCVALKVLLNGTEQAPTSPLPEASDPRMQWPIHMFQYMCDCSFFYSGLACETSKLHFGKGGSLNPFKNFFEPTAADKRVRRDVTNLTKAERMHVRDVLLKSKEKLSDWVILDDTVTGKNADGSKKVSYFNVSVYDYFVFLNFYATKGGNKGPSSGVIDLAHKSPNALAWNRVFLSQFERALDDISRNLTLTQNPAATTIPPFALPYWNWTDQADCQPCSDDLLGAMDADDSLSTTSPFASWRVLCSNEDPGTHPCDPRGSRPLLKRSLSDDPLHDTLPTAAELNATLNATKLDVAPYNELANSSSFRNMLEGYIGADNNFTAAAEGQRYMGMKVRKFINGTWTNLALGPNDPLFWLHQAFLDKIFDAWRNKSAKDATDFPLTYTALPGQNKSENMAPFLPPIPNWRAMFASGRLFSTGYSYDTDVTGVAKQGETPESLWTSSAALFLVALVVAAVGVVLVAVIRRQAWRKYREVQALKFDPVTERLPLLPRAL